MAPIIILSAADNTTPKRGRAPALAARSRPVISSNLRGKKTSTIKADNNSPTWNEVLLTASTTQLTTGSVKLQLMDDDIGADGVIGGITWLSGLPAATLAAGKADVLLVKQLGTTGLKAKSVVTLTFQKPWRSRQPAGAHGDADYRRIRRPPRSRVTHPAVGWNS
jgi:hypothetical protein